MDLLVVNDALRIRLEGRLEALESVVAGWEEAARALDGTAWRALPALPALPWQFTTGLRRWAETEPLFARLEDARVAVELGVTRRLKQLGVTGERALEDGMALLHAEGDARYQRRLSVGWALMRAGMFGVGLLTSFVLLVLRAGDAAHPWILDLGPTDVLMTGRTLVLGGKATRLSAIDHVTIGFSGAMTVVLKNGRALPAWAPGRPEALSNGLRAAGIPCHVETGAWF